MDYSKAYNSLINKAQSRVKPDCYTESHHIIPKSLGGSNDASNLIDLTAREHCLAHLLLAKIYGGVLWTSVVMMTSKFKLNSRAYASSREKYSKFRSKKMQGEKNHMFGRVGEKAPMFGRSGKNHPLYGKPCLITKEKHPNFRGAIKATEIISGKTIILVGKKEIIAAGFKQSSVSNCVLGKQKAHKGYTFTRIPK